MSPIFALMPLALQGQQEKVGIARWLPSPLWVCITAEQPQALETLSYYGLQANLPSLGSGGGIIFIALIKTNLCFRQGHYLYFPRLFTMKHIFFT